MPQSIKRPKRPDDIPIGGITTSHFTNEQVATLATLYLQARAVLEDRDTPRSLTPLVRYYHHLIQDPEPLEIDPSYA